MTTNTWIWARPARTVATVPECRRCGVALYPDEFGICRECWDEDDDDEVKA